MNDILGVDLQAVGISGFNRLGSASEAGEQKSEANGTFHSLISQGIMA